MLRIQTLVILAENTSEIIILKLWSQTQNSLIETRQSLKIGEEAWDCSSKAIEL